MPHQIIDEINFRAVHIRHGDGINQHSGAEFFDDDVILGLCVDEVIFIGKAGAAATFDRNAKRGLSGSESRILAIRLAAESETVMPVICLVPFAGTGIGLCVLEIFR